MDEKYDFRYYFKQAMQQGEGVEMAIGATSGEPGYYFSKAVRLKKEQAPIGVLVLKMKPMVLKQIIDFHADEEFDVMLVDQYGIVVHSNNKEKQYKSLRYMSTEEKAEAQAGRRFSDTEIQSLGYGKAYIEIQAGRTGAFEIYNAKEEVDKIITISPLNNFDYSVLIDTQSQAIDLVVNRIAFWQVFLIVGSITLIALVFIYFLNKALSPLKELSETAKKITQGKMDKRARVQTEDEIGRLAKNFNKMVNKIIKVKNEVDKKVEEKTRDLEKTNRFMTDRELKMVKLKKKIRQLENELEKQNKKQTENDGNSKSIRNITKNNES